MTVNETGPTGVPRRQLLQGSVVATGALAAGSLLAACGDDQAQTAPVDGPPQAPDPAPGATTASGVVVAAADVPIGGGTITSVGDRKVVVTQPEAGTYAAFSAVCPHQGCSVGSVDADAITCPCHGSQFSPSTGEVLRGPDGAPTSSIAPLAPIPVAQQGDDIVFA
jgi:nitrite reductase/ring-hydroxylating ferredoxin subunit